MLDVVDRRKRALFARRMYLQKIKAERAMARRGQAQLRRELKQAGDAYAKTGLISEAVRVVDTGRPWWAEYLRIHHTKIGKISANQILKASAKSAGPVEMKDFERYKDRWADQVRRRGAKKVVQVSETTKESIRQAIKTGTAAGGSQYDIAKEIYNLRIGGAGKMNARLRARTISRTESQFAYQGSAQAAAETIPFKVEKEWVSSADERTRESHDAANEQRVGLKETFKLEGPACSLMYPGDPDGPPGQVINCRCGVIYHRINRPVKPPPSKPKPGREPPKPKPTEITKRTYRKAKSVDEAGSLAQSELNLADVASYEGVNLDVANAINRSLVRSYNEYGHMVPESKFPTISGQRKMAEICVKEPPDGEQWVAWVSSYESPTGHAWVNLTVSPTKGKKGKVKYSIDDYKRDWKMSQDAVAEGRTPYSASGWLPGKTTPQKSVEKVMDHEFGHVISTHILHPDESILPQDLKVWRRKWIRDTSKLKRQRVEYIQAAEDALSEGTIARMEWANMLQRGYKPGIEGRGFHSGYDLSKYAATNDREEFAEIWTVHSGGGDYLLPPEITDLLEELSDIMRKKEGG